MHSHPPLRAWGLHVLSPLKQPRWVSVFVWPWSRVGITNSSFRALHTASALFERFYLLVGTMLGCVLRHRKQIARNYIT